MPRKIKATAKRPRPHMTFWSLPRGKMPMPSRIENAAQTQEENAITIPAAAKGRPTLLSASISILEEVGIRLFS
jgi:hypothetical protein